MLPWSTQLLGHPIFLTPSHPSQVTMPTAQDSTAKLNSFADLYLIGLPTVNPFLVEEIKSKTAKWWSWKFASCETITVILAWLTSVLDTLALYSMPILSPRWWDIASVGLRPPTTQQWVWSGPQWGGALLWLEQVRPGVYTELQTASGGWVYFIVFDSILYFGPPPPQNMVFTAGVDTTVR